MNGDQNPVGSACGRTDRPAAATTPLLAVSPTSDLVARNRINAKASTGPRSKVGKSRAAQNARKHGLTANPARGTDEDAAAFDRLLEAVTARLCPSNIIEAALVHRIALAIWRQQRAARAEAALATVALTGLTHDHQEVQRWTERIVNAWVPVMHERPPRDPDSGRCIKRLPPTIIFQRTRLTPLDGLREDEMYRSGAAMTAMIVMIESLAARLEGHQDAFHADHAEQLAWLLGDCAGYFPIIDTMQVRNRPNLTRTLKLIVAAMDRPNGSPLEPHLVHLLNARIDTLEHQRRYCEKPHTDKHQRALMAAALLPAGEVLDRLLRYETHADKTLLRALDTLARLRGVTVETLSTTVTTHHQEPMGVTGATGTTLQVAASKMAVKPIQRAR